MIKPQLFISYRHSQEIKAQDLEQQLEEAGFNVFLDQSNIETTDSISDEVKEGLSSSHVMLVLFSNDYPESRFCQFELTTAYIAAFNELNGAPNKRIFVLNLDEGKDKNSKALEKLPIELQGALHLPGDHQSLIEAIRTQMDIITHQGNKTLGELGAFQFAPGYGRRIHSSPRFVGREAYFWQLHSALQQTQNPMITGQTNPDLAEVSGMGGIGKTLLAEEYALRFAAAYPGGIFWLDAYGSFDPKAPDIETFKAACTEQYRKVAAEYGLQLAHDADLPAIQYQIQQKIKQQGQRCLWIVDDIPSGLAKHLNNEIKTWFSPCPELAPTLVTTRSREYSTIGKDLPLDVLDHEAARQLLRHHLKEKLDHQNSEADQLIEKLGHHSLALDIAGTAIAEYQQSIAEYLEELDEDIAELIDVPDEIVAAVPTGCEKSIVRSLQKSILKLSDNSLDFLRLAANLAPAPIKQSLFAEILKVTDELSASKARKQAKLSLLGCKQLNLSKQFEPKEDDESNQTDERFWSVHALVSEVIRFMDESENERSLALKTTAIIVLTRVIKVMTHGTDYQSIQAISSEIEHSRYLTQNLQSEYQKNLLITLGEFEHHRGNPKLAIRYWQIISNYYEEILGKDASETLSCMNNLASAYGNIGDHAKARELQEYVLEQRLISSPENEQSILSSMNNLASTLCHLKELPRARKLQEDVLDKSKALFSDKDPKIIAAMNNLASTLFHLGDYPEAKKLQEGVLERLKALPDKNYQDILTVMNNLAYTFWFLSEWEDAIELMIHTNRGFVHFLGKDHLKTLKSQSTLISFMTQVGLASKAKPLIFELQQTLEQKPELKQLFSTGLILK
ncbi:tetratricopeptide repeat protein [Oceanospirillum sediminis]|uniref:Tetratricopeptide repeat protein n=1 Tax=Oceanospirillum sediminis TaxID=2760088 RepID=A0A839INV6_9GAMM|nr:tetratricopeptide repeat protein [Oceanospirillum sediminis]MBB1486192.1 tetratricopeptide repeat protein [Oceanospirillum sediminis]